MSRAAETALHTARRLYHGIPSTRLRGILFRGLLKALRGRRVIVVRQEITFDLDLSEMIDVSVFLGGYERDVRGLIDRFCRPGFVAVDVGANIGAHSLYMARSVGEFGMVIAFEPTTFAFAKLERNVSLNPGLPIRLIKLALGSTDDDAREEEIRASWRTDGRQAREREIVKTVRLDTWWKREGPPALSFLKIDVDGREGAVLRGARELLSRFRPVIGMEVGEWHFEDGADNPIRILTGLGYRIWSADGATEFLDEGEIRKSCRGGFSINVLALPRESARPWAEDGSASEIGS